jgi:general secretion pathway protein A
MTEQAFLEELQRSELVDSAMRAANGLLRVWGVHELQTGEWRNGALDLTTIARTRRLEYLPLNGAVNLLSLLDLPVILELVTPVRGETRFVLLLGITTDRCRVLLDREREIPLRVLNEYWFGKAHLFWKDFENVGILLTVGSIGQNVRRLHTLLSKVQGTDGKPFPGRLDTFSRQTEERVARFQKAKRLTPDGVIGPQTMVVLYNSLPGYSHPSLKTMGNATADTPVETPGKMTQAGSTPNASLAKGGT